MQTNKKSKLAISYFAKLKVVSSLFMIIITGHLLTKTFLFLLFPLQQQLKMPNSPIDKSTFTEKTTKPIITESNSKRTNYHTQRQATNLRVDCAGSNVQFNQQIAQTIGAIFCCTSPKKKATVATQLYLCSFFNFFATSVQLKGKTKEVGHHLVLQSVSTLKVATSQLSQNELKTS